MVKKQKETKKFTNRRSEQDLDLEKKPAMFWAIVALVVLVVVIGCGVALWATKGETSDTKKDTNTTQTKPKEEKPVAKEPETPQEDTNQPETSAKITEVTTTVSPSQSGYLVIKQWGIAYKIPQGFNDIAFWLESQGSMNNILFFADGVDSDCPIGGKVVQSSTVSSTSTQGFKVGDMYYFIEKVDGTCNSKWADAVWQMVQNPVGVVQ
ncbi:hypothetical protein FWF48_03775 [Candidatus Saccharibacteria bacterium]|nr:hypothetical protein [Candidatus Saccharibacteria bacterium]